MTTSVTEPCRNCQVRCRMLVPLPLADARRSHQNAWRAPV